MKKHILGLAVTMALTSTAMAESYNAEIEGGLAKTDIDINGADSANTYMLGGTVYFKPVETDNMPLAEAAFLNRASNVNGGIAHTTNDNDDATISNIGAEWYIANTNFYTALNFVKIDGDGLDGDALIGTVGYMPIDGLLLTTSIADEGGYEPNIDVKYVAQLSGGTALGLHGGITDSDGSTFYNAGVDYYFSPATSIGIEYDDVTGIDGVDLSETTINGKHFFSEAIYVGAYYSNTDFTDTLGVNAGIRF